MADKQTIKTDRNQGMALGGLFQALGLVKEIAYRGTFQEQPFTCCIRSIFMLDPETIDEIYGGGKDIHDGIVLLCNQLGRRKGKRDMELTRYAIGVMTLENELHSRQALFAEIRHGIQRIAHQTETVPYADQEIVEQLASLYRETISGLTPRIVVEGEQGHLKNPANAARVRALLLSAIRAVVLWRQCGGTRWRLLTRRRKLLQVAQQMLE